jgi:hypothetical protein
VNELKAAFRHELVTLQRSFGDTATYVLPAKVPPDMKKPQVRRYNQDKAEKFARQCEVKYPALFTHLKSDLSRAIPSLAMRNFLSSLDFNRIHDRYDSIEQAHQKTLQWVLLAEQSASPETSGGADASPIHPLSSPPHETVTWSNFPSWLASSSSKEKIYWITGLPGSGKSTLMRFLADSDRVAAMMQERPSATSVLVLKCFFWHSGTSLQRSLEGLLRTLVHQALNLGALEEAEVSKLSPSAWHTSSVNLTRDYEWSPEELFQLFAGLIELTSRRANLLVFIDGLDEFGSDREARIKLVQYLLDLSNQSTVKMCLSSRPWSEFGDRLGNFPRLRLEDVNRLDMKAFVDSELATNCSVQELAQVAPDEIAHLLAQIVEKSSGVFLWLRLVVRRLKSAAEDGTSVRKLREMLDEMPPDLDNFFEHMLQRISPKDRLQASKIFQIVLDESAACRPDLMMLSFTDELELDFALSNAVKNETSSEIRSRTIAMQRKINSQCMDLLVYPSHSSSFTAYNLVPHWGDLEVSYLHRTARDFLMADTSRALLTSYTGGRFDTARYRLNACVAQLWFAQKFMSDKLAMKNGHVSCMTALFSVCMYMLAEENMAATEVDMQLLENIVAVFTPRLIALHLTGNAFDQMHFENYRSRYLPGDGSSRERNQADDDNRFWGCTLEICREYAQVGRRVHENTQRLLLATLGGLTSIASIYGKHLGDPSDAWIVFEQAILQTRWPPHQVHCDLLQTICTSGSSFDTPEKATAIMERYHTLLKNHAVRLLGTFGEDVNITNTLLTKMDGFVVTKTELKSLQISIESSIRATFGARSQSLIETFERIRKTWTIIANSLGQPTASPSAFLSRSKSRAATTVTSKEGFSFRKLFGTT